MAAPDLVNLSGHLVDLWAYRCKVRIDFSRPGKPTDNAFIETFNGSLRDECLNRWALAFIHLASIRLMLRKLCQTTT